MAKVRFLNDYEGTLAAEPRTFKKGDEVELDDFVVAQLVGAKRVALVGGAKTTTETPANVITGTEPPATVVIKTEKGKDNE